MVPRAILAVRVGSNKFKGVFHAEDSEPWHLGDHLLSRVIRARGDLEKVVNEVIHETPWGWMSLGQEQKSSLKKRPNRRLFSQNILRKRDELEIDWIYLFDLDDRTLTISRAKAATSDGTEEDPFVQITFNERGRPSPRQIVSPPPPWPTHPTAESWEGDIDDLVDGRQNTLEVTDDWCARVDMEPDVLGTLVGAALWRLIEKQMGEIETVWVPAPLRDGHVFWTVDLAGRQLHYPSPVWRQALADAGLANEEDELELWASSQNQGKIKISPRDVLGGYDGLDWPFPEIPAVETIATPLRGVAAARYPRSDIDSKGLRVFRYMRVVEEIKDSDREILLPANNTNTEMGAEVENTLLLKWKWELLDWLRTNQLVEVEDEDEDEDEA